MHAAARGRDDRDDETDKGRAGEKEEKDGNTMSLEETILKLQEKLLFLQEQQQQQQLSLQLRKVLHEEGKQSDPTTLTSAVEPDS